MDYAAKNYEHLLGLEGFSDTLLKNHFTLYQGYVTNTNTLMGLLKDAKPGPESAELRRRLGWEWNGMRLHELYFDNLAKAAPGIEPQAGFVDLVAKQWGSFDAWKAEFNAIGTMRGIGWVILYQDANGNLFNQWINEHDVGHLAGTKPLVVMDVFEHAFMVDYGLKRADYIAAFWKNVNWAEVAKRLG